MSTDSIRHPIDQHVNHSKPLTLIKVFTQMTLVCSGNLCNFNTLQQNENKICKCVRARMGTNCRVCARSCFPHMYRHRLSGGSKIIIFAVLPDMRCQTSWAASAVDETNPIVDANKCTYYRPTCRRHFEYLSKRS